MSEIDPKPYHRQPDEPNRWFHRFEHFKNLGPGRSLARCYREIINVERARAGRPLLPSTASVPHVWRQRARQYDWEDRAESWDQEEMRRERRKIERVRSVARDLSMKAIRILESTMLGELKNPDGTLTPGQNCAQRRIAAEKILDLVGVRVVDLDDDDDLDGIKAIRIIDPSSPEGIEHAERVRQRVNAQSRDRKNWDQSQDQNKLYWFDRG